MKIVRLTISVAGLLIGLAAQGQVLSYPFIGKTFGTSYASGSSRMLGMGGHYNALGADITSISGNPAGLGFYNRSEINLTGSVSFTNVSSNYINNQTSKTDNQVSISGFGIVLSGEETGDWKGNLGVAYSKQILLNRSFSVSGLNNASSLLDSYIEKANRNGETGTSLDNQYDSQSNTALTPEAVAYQSYLINPDSKTGKAPFYRLEPNLPTQQNGLASTEGYQSQWDISYGLNYKQKLYLGFGIHLTKVQATFTNSWDESFIGAKYVSGFSYNEKLLSSGNGYGLTLGLMYKLNSKLRAGFSFTSPTYYTQINEQLSGGMNTRAIGIPAFDSNGSPITITRVGAVYLATNEFTYQLTTPMKIGGGLSYFIGKKGFLSFDLEMVDYSQVAVSSTELSYSANANFKEKYNSQSKRYFQSDLNIKIGGEFRVSPSISLRAGIAQFGGGYQKTFDAIDRTALQFSGGLGYKSNGFFIDLGFVHRSQKEAFTPYTLTNVANYASSELTIKNTMVSITGGLYF